jgi:MFS family permease
MLSTHTRAPLFTARFLVMCGFSFTVFVSAFQLFPVAPFRILELGGTTLTAGLFLGLLTYASATSAPLTGALADRVGRRRQLVVCSLVMVALAAGYSVASRPALILLLALVHGIFWSGLLSASAAYTADLIPPDRRAEGLGIHGLSAVLAVAVAPSIGLWFYGGGWPRLCASIGMLSLAMAAIAWRLPDDDAAGRPPPTAGDFAPRLERRLLRAGVTLFLVALGYGGVTSFAALMADQAGVRPRAWYFTVMALTIVGSRTVIGRLADRVGTQRVLPPALLAAAAGYLVLVLPGTFWTFTASALLVGAGFGSAYPVFAAWILLHVPADGRGAAFGGILAALDMGIGTGAIATGWIADRLDFRTAFAASAVLALCSVPYHGWVGRPALEGSRR